MKPKVLVWGEEVTQDKTLLKLLRRKAIVSILRDLRKLEKTIRQQNITLVIFELSEAWEDDLSLVKSLKASFPKVLVVIINDGGSPEVVIQGFRSGARDFFKKPYIPKLLAERVEALLKAKSADKNKNNGKFYA